MVKGLCRILKFKGALGAERFRVSCGFLERGGMDLEVCRVAMVQVLCKIDGLLFNNVKYGGALQTES